LEPNNVPANYLYRINANGPTIDMGTEPDFLGLPADDLTAIPGVTVSGETQGAVAPDGTTWSNIPLGIPEEIFQTVIGTQTTAGSTQNWAFDVPNGLYEVRMYWGEHNDTIEDPGDRLFDVFLEGNLVYDDFDMLVEAGGHNSAIAESQIVEVTDGELNFDITAVVSVGIIRGIEILGGGDRGGDATPPVPALLADAEMALARADRVTDPGVSATDSGAGDIAEAVMGGGDVGDTGTVGTYVITYNVSDAAGNDAIEVTRT